MENWVLHVDLDQFVAAVEVLRRPQLRGRPVIVGGKGIPSYRAVVSSASYEARAYGVHSGQPLRIAQARCPGAVFLPVDREAYDRASQAVMATLRGTDAVVEVMGWDEAFLDVRSDDPLAYAREVARRVLADTGLACTVGVGRNKLQAKMATGFGKPAGVFRLTDENWAELLGGARTNALWGIGSALTRRLWTLRIRTVAQLAAADPESLVAEFGPRTAGWLTELANGRLESAVSGAPRVARSRSRETTFQQDLADWDEVHAVVERMARELTAEAVEAGRWVGQVVVKVRLVPYTTLTRSRAVKPATIDPSVAAEAAIIALARVERRRAVRLLGVQVVYGEPPPVTVGPL